MDMPTDLQQAVPLSTANLPRIARLITAVNWRLLLTAGALLVIFGGLFAYVQYGTSGLTGTDGYYHARMGLLLREQGLKPEFSWLPFTILKADSFYDHHMLYHLYLALFAGVDPAVDGGLALTQGAKMASIIMPTLAFLAIWWLLRSLQVRWAALWAVALFAVSEAFLYRMSMPRAQSASLLVLALGLHCMINRRYWLLLPLGMLYVWLYNAFPLLLLIGSIYLVATWLTERRFAWQAVLFPAAGIGLGLVVNPYFPQNISFIINHLLPKVGDPSTRVGNEWYPYETWTLVENSGFALAAIILAMMAWSWRKDRIDGKALTILMITILMGFMLFRSRRFIEYFPAFALLLAAVSISPLLEDWLSRHPKFENYAPFAMMAIIIGPLLFTVSGARDAVGRSKPADQFAQAALWLGKNTPDGALIFQTDWDDFPRLFFYNTDNPYTAGLDPTYMSIFNSQLYDEWKDISRGIVDNPGQLIRERFGAAFVFSDLNHNEFLDQAADDPLLAEVYRDKYAVIFAAGE